MKKAPSSATITLSGLESVRLDNAVRNWAMIHSATERAVVRELRAKLVSPEFRATYGMPDNPDGFRVSIKDSPAQDIELTAPEQQMLLGALKNCRDQAGFTEEVVDFAFELIERLENS